MIKDHKENGTSYKNVVTFNLDEYIGLKRDHSQTYWKMCIRDRGMPASQAMQKS